MQTAKIMCLKRRPTREKSLLEKAKAVLSDGGKAGKAAQCSLKIKKIKDIDKKLGAMFEHPIWDEVTKGCIGCGTCTYVCPTCYCFDIDSENYTGEGVKYRCWDSCMFSDYTRMAGGHNPRPTKRSACATDTCISCAILTKDTERHCA